MEDLGRGLGLSQRFTVYCGERVITTLGLSFASLLALSHFAEEYSTISKVNEGDASGVGTDPADTKQWPVLDQPKRGLSDVYTVQKPSTSDFSTKTVS